MRISYLLVIWSIWRSFFLQVHGQVDPVSSLRQLHEVCKGKCYYFAEKDSKHGDCASKGEECAAILSIERFAPKCNTTVHTRMNQVFCCETTVRGGSLYRVKLAVRDPSDESCYMTERNCRPREFVAVAFSQNTNPDAEDNPYFTCITSTPFTRSVRQAKGKTDTQMPLIRTSPFNVQAVSTFWSTVETPEDRSLYCSFIISSRKFNFLWNQDWDEKTNITENDLVNDVALNCSMSEDPNVFSYNDTTGNTNPPKSFEFGNGTSKKWYIKVARGRIVRSIDLGLLESIPIRTTAQCLIDKPGSNECEKEKIWVVDELFDPSMLPKLPIPTDPKKNNSADHNANKEALSKVIKSCISKKSLCYHMEKERGCLHKEQCHYLVAIKEVGTDFKKLHFDIIMQTPDYPGEIKLTRPRGWVGFGISKDSAMGLDFVLTCSAFGDLTKSYVTLNIRRSNLYLPKYQSLIENSRTYIWEKNPKLEPFVMCSFDLKTSFHIDEQRFKNTKYDLSKKEYFILMAQGSDLTDKWDISYHTKDSREIAELKFSRAIYNEQTGGIGRLIVKNPLYYIFTVFFVLSYNKLFLLIINWK